MSWRERARITISREFEANPDLDHDAMKKALSEAYPFGGRENWPYKTWCDECRRQLAIRFGVPYIPLADFQPRKNKSQQNENQMELPQQ